MPGLAGCSKYGSVGRFQPAVAGGGPKGARMAAANANAPMATIAGACEEIALTIALATTGGLAGSSSSSAQNSMP